MKKASSLAMSVLLTIFLVACQSENPHEKLSSSTPPPSQSQDSESYERATGLEGISYQMLTMPRRQWERINQIAA